MTIQPKCSICFKEYHGGFERNTCTMECFIRSIIRSESDDGKIKELIHK